MVGEVSTRKSELRRQNRKRAFGPAPKKGACVDCGAPTNYTRCKPHAIARANTTFLDRREKREKA